MWTWAMGGIGLLLWIVAILAVAALIKYLFGGSGRGQ